MQPDRRCGKEREVGMVRIEAVEEKVQVFKCLGSAVKRIGECGEKKKIKKCKCSRKVNKKFTGRCVTGEEG